MAGDKYEVSGVPDAALSLRRARAARKRVMAVAVVGWLLAVALGVLLLVLYLTQPSAAHGAPESGASPSPETSASGASNYPQVEDHEELAAPWRLPTSLRPTQYKIWLKPHLDPAANWSVEGMISVMLNCSEDTNIVTFNAKDIIIEESSVTIMKVENGSSEALPVVDQSHNERAQTYTVVLGEALVQDGKYRLDMNFTAFLGDQLQGFYRSSYTIGNQVRWMASTQFSPIDARRAFPCWDEPSFKASFIISIVRPSNMHSMSNSPMRQSTNLGDGWIQDDFAETPPMSTYLVAMVVHDLKQLPTMRHHGAGPHFRFWARSDVISNASFVAQIAPQMLRHLEEYFGVAFPLAKVDMVAVPDFGYSAMENWGLITFRELSMLLDTNVKASTAAARKNVAYVVGHELAHQWFGNLVTPKWWSDLWLKEGFAEFVGHLEAVAHVEPTWKMEEQFLTNTVHTAMRMDCLNSSHSLTVEIDEPEYIREIFDPISYSKGASMLRMLRSVVGKETFRRALTRYLVALSYGNAEKSDLWSALSHQAHLEGTLPKNMEVARVMEEWTTRPGFPVVHVERKYGENASAVANQTRFLIYGEAANVEWWVPISVVTEEAPDFNNTLPSTWLSPGSGPVEIPAPSDSNWMLVNVQQTGYYRVNYDIRNWAMLTDAWDKLGDVVRAQLLSDALVLARAGQLTYAVPLELVALKLGTDGSSGLAPWTAALSEVAYLERMLIRTPAYENFKEVMLQALKQQYDLLGTEDRPRHSHLEQRRRVLVVSWACSLGHEECIWQARNKWRTWMGSTINPIPGNERSTVYCTALKYGGGAEWNFAWKQFLAASIPEERANLLDALGCTREPWLLSRYLKSMLDPSSGIRKQDGSRVFAAVASNEMGFSMAFSFLRNNWNALQKYYGTAFNSISKMAGSLGSFLNSENDIDQLKAFREEVSSNLGTTGRSFEQLLEEVSSNVLWMERSYSEVEVWLAHHKDFGTR